MILNPPHAEPSYRQVAYDRPIQSGLAQGSEGIAIDQGIRQFLKELRKRSDWQGVNDEDNSSSYRHVPLKSVGTIRVQFREAVPMKPRQFHFDDEDE